MHRLVVIPLALGLVGPPLAFAACSSGASDGGGDAGHHADAGSPQRDSTVDTTSRDVREAGRDGEADARADGTGDAMRDAPFMTAKHPPLPKLVNYGAPGAGVLTAPQIVTVTFAGDPMAKEYEALGAGIASSTWWDAVRPGYCDSEGGPCVGDGPPGVAVEIATPAAASYTDAELRTWIKTQIAAGVLPKPAAGKPSQTLYVLYLPQSTVVHSGGRSCFDFFGYHNDFEFTDPDGGARQKVAYAIVDECTIPGADGGVSEAGTFAATTETASHEILEATTDPVNGFYLDLNDPGAWGWNDVLGGECGDLCDWFGPPPDYATWAGENVAYSPSLTVQRIWSNPQVAAGRDPCLPVPPGVVFFEVAPEQQVFVLDVGGSVTFDAYAYSTAPVADWTVLALVFTPASKPYLSFSVAGAVDTDAGPAVKVNNGHVLKVTVTLLGDPGKTANGEADGVFLSYSGPPDNPTAAYLWPFIVITPSDATEAGLDAAISMRPVHKHVPGSPMPSIRSRIRAAIAGETSRGETDPRVPAPSGR